MNQPASSNNFASAISLAETAGSSSVPRISMKNKRTTLADENNNPPVMKKFSRSPA
jgi:hypothetical protein